MEITKLSLSATAAAFLALSGGAASATNVGLAALYGANHWRWRNSAAGNLATTGSANLAYVYGQ